MAGKPFQVVYRDRSGASHTVDGLRSAGEADVVHDALSIKEALDAGEELGRLELCDGSGPPWPSLVSEAQRSPAVASLPFAHLVQQLQRCADRARQESEMLGHGKDRAFTLLHAAASCEHKEAALLLLAAAPSMSQQRDRLGRVALHAAAGLGWADVVATIMMVAPEAATARDDFGVPPLVHAHARGQLEAARALMSATLSSPSVGETMASMLRKAVEQRRVREQAALLWFGAASGTDSRGASLLDDMLSDMGPLLLRTAVDRIDVGTTRLLLEAAPWLATQRDSEGQTALHWVAALWYVYAHIGSKRRELCQLAELLLAVPGTATAVDSQGRTALFLALDAAAEAGRHLDDWDFLKDAPNILRILAAAAPATVALPAATGQTPVHLAILNKAVLEAFLEAAPDQVAATVTAATGLQTPLQLAVEECRLEAVAQLLDAVMQASRSGGQDGPAAAWQLLLEANHAPEALAELADVDDRTLLHAAAGRPTAALLQLLLSEHAGGVMAADDCGRLPLYVAAEHGRADAVRLLLAAAPAAAMVPSDLGDLPLHQNAASGNTATLRLLLEAAPQAATAGDWRGQLPLHWAAQSGSAEAVRLLLEAAPQAATAGDWKGQLPLHWAAQVGNCEAVQLLLEAAPATLSSQTRNGETALMVALLHGHTDAAKILMRHGSTQEVLRDLRAAVDSGLDRPDTIAELSAVLVAARLPLSAIEWALLPRRCWWLGRVLPAALQHSIEQAQQLMRRLPAADAERLRVAALALARVQRRLWAHMPGALVGRILSLVLS